MASKEKKFSFSFNSGEVMYTSIRKSSGGYNYATVGIKRGDDQFVNIDYEWKGTDVPDFALDLLLFMQANKKETSSSKKMFKEESDNFILRLQEFK